MIEEKIQYIGELFRILSYYHIDINDICLLSSCTLAIRDIKKNNDIEFALRPNVRAELETLFSDSLVINKYSRVIKFRPFVDNCVDLYKAIGVYDEALFSDECSCEYEGIRIVNPEIFTAQALLQNRKKDDIYITMIKNSGLWTKTFKNKVERYLDQARKNGIEIAETDSEYLWRSIFDSNKKVYIFGTGHIGEHLFQRVISEGFEDRLSGFVISKMEDTTNTFCGKPVKLLQNIQIEDPIVIVAVLFCIMPETIDLVRRSGITDVIQGFQFLL